MTHYEIEDLPFSTKDLHTPVVASAATLILVEEELAPTPLETIPYALILEESIILWAIPEVEKTEADDDDDVLFLKEMHLESPNLICIPLPPQEAFSLPPYSPYVHSYSN